SPQCTEPRRARPSNPASGAPQRAVAAATMTAPFDPVPDDARTVCDPEWLATALDFVGPEDRIVAVEPRDSLRTVAEKVRFAVVVERADGPHDRRPFCAKGHFGDAFNSLLTEAHVYRDLLPDLPVRAPRAHYCGIDDDGGRGLILMDDVEGLGGRFVGS